MTQPTRIVIAGVEVEARYDADDDPLIPVGTLTMAIVRLTSDQHGRDIEGSGHALVGMSRIDPTTGTVTEWQVGLPSCGWISGVTWPTVEEAVKSVRTPATVTKLRKYDQLAQQATAASAHADDLQSQAEAMRDKLLADIGAMRSAAF